MKDTTNDKPRAQVEAQGNKSADYLGTWLGTHFYKVRETGEYFSIEASTNRQSVVSANVIGRLQ